MAKEYPMTFDEYEKRVMELLFEGMNPLEKKRNWKRIKRFIRGGTGYV